MNTEQITLADEQYQTLGFQESYMDQRSQDRLRSIITKAKIILARISLVASLTTSGLAATALHDTANAETVCAGGTHSYEQGHLLLASTDWLGGSGVDVKANNCTAENNSGPSNVMNSANKQIYAGEMWQCVELVNRLYLSKGWISDTWWGNGDTLKDNLLPGLTYQTNGSVDSLSPGDIITLDNRSVAEPDAPGHAMVVDSIDNDGTIHTVSQNTISVWNDLTIKGSVISGAWSGYSVQGVIHHPTDPESTTPPPPSPSNALTPYAAIGEGSIVTNNSWVYKKEAGVLWPIKPLGQWTGSDARYWGSNPATISATDQQNNEAGYSAGGLTAGAHPPGNGADLYYDGGNGQQYYFVQGLSGVSGVAYPIGPGELADLGVGNQAHAVPATGNRLAEFVDQPLVLPSGTLFRFAGDPTVRLVMQQPDGSLQEFIVGNDTMLDCEQSVQGRPLVILPQAARSYLYGSNGAPVREISQPAACSFPSGWVLFGPGGQEQWRISGDGSSQPYMRQYYPNALTVYLNTSGNPQYHTLRSVAAINDLPQGPDMTLPNGIFMLIPESGQQFKVENGLFRPIPWPDMNACLGNTNPVPVPGSIVGPVPQGPAMGCAYDNKILVRPSGQAYYLQNGSKHPIPDPAVRDCLIGRDGTGPWSYASDATIDSYVDGPPAYCPYNSEPGLNFVEEQGDPTVWLVDEQGIKRHVGSLCVVDPFTTVLKKFHVFSVPAGETAGLAQGPDWFATPQTCGVLAG